MTAPTIEIELIEDGSATGTLKYLVAETNQDPFVAQDIHALLEDVVDFDSTDVYLLMPDMTPVPVNVTGDLHNDHDWSVRLSFDDDYGHLIEHVIYSEDQFGPDGRSEVEVHTQYVNGWPDPAS